MAKFFCLFCGRGSISLGVQADLNYFASDEIFYILFQVLPLNATQRVQALTSELLLVNYCNYRGSSS
jgi:hypothetical protein